jgi:hypothetical protein
LRATGRFEQRFALLAMMAMQHRSLHESGVPDSIETLSRAVGKIFHREAAPLVDIWHYWEQNNRILVPEIDKRVPFRLCLA